MQRGETKREKLTEIRVHGRGGQGNVVAAELLAQAAFAAGKHVQAFPAFGAERTGAPVVAYVRIANRPIRLRSQVYTPDIVIIQDATLLLVNRAAVLGGLKPGGLVIVNAPTIPPALVAGVTTRARVVAVPATDIAIDTLGRPTPNTTLLGAVATLTRAFPLEAVQQVVRDRFPGQIGDRNARAAERGYDAARRATVQVVNPLTSVAPSFARPQAVPLSVGLVAVGGTSAGPNGYHTGAWRVFRPEWDPTRCTDCRLCEVYCPDSVVTRLGPRHYTTDLAFCKGCALCAEECPSEAIVMRREEE